MHVPVLLNEVLEYLDPQPGDFIIDGTIDGGGHAGAILERIGPAGMFLGLDWDPELLKSCEERLAGEGKIGVRRSSKVFLVQGNYAELPAILKEKKMPLADGLLLDLGFSSEQLASSGRGFSFLKDEPLLMIYDDSRMPVREILKKLSERELAQILRDYGGERLAGRIAKAIIGQERRKLIATSGELAETVRAAVPKNYERGRIDPATRTFQALRIFANGELENLSRILGCLEAVVRPGGRVAIISFHSLEDRIVKQAFQKMKKEAIAGILTKKPVIATAEEMKKNPRSRSAKLRAIKMISDSRHSASH
ncbi:MAG: 16S rRNA (cytosine(1402)-N(4))-methyltransferase RsmH [Patescibacteria group bacterium]|nr:16S rRNA (cytosine(1402)-N(4))-methyltransferase RsmH [Patescibacteria group bacterium]